ncbi:MAG: hypothetical protein WCJ19_03255 [bacterium]
MSIIIKKSTATLYIIIISSVLAVTAIILTVVLLSTGTIGGTKSKASTSSCSTVTSLESEITSLKAQIAGGEADKSSWDAKCTEYNDWVTICANPSDGRYSSCPGAETNTKAACDAAKLEQNRIQGEINANKNALSSKQTELDKAINNCNLSNYVTPTLPPCNGINKTQCRCNSNSCPDGYYRCDTSGYGCLYGTSDATTITVTIGVSITLRQCDGSGVACMCQTNICPQGMYSCSSSNPFECVNTTGNTRPKCDGSGTPCRCGINDCPSGIYSCNPSNSNECVNTIDNPCGNGSTNSKCTCPSGQSPFKPVGDTNYICANNTPTPKAKCVDGSFDSNCNCETGKSIYLSSNGAVYCVTNTPAPSNPSCGTSSFDQNCSCDISQYTKIISSDGESWSCVRNTTVPVATSSACGQSGSYNSQCTCSVAGEGPVPSSNGKYYCNLSIANAIKECNDTGRIYYNGACRDGSYWVCMANSTVNIDSTQNKAWCTCNSGYFGDQTSGSLVCNKICDGSTTNASCVCTDSSNERPCRTDGGVYLCVPRTMSCNSIQ